MEIGLVKTFDLARSKSLLNYNMIDDTVWISQDIKALIFAEG
jgi:hypothetical protein